MTDVLNPYNKCPIAPGTYVVLCRDDRQLNGEPGKYTLASSKGFKTRTDAIRFRDSCSSSRDPYIARVTK